MATGGRRALLRHGFEGTVAVAQHRVSRWRPALQVVLVVHDEARNNGGSSQKVEHAQVLTKQDDASQHAPDVRGEEGEVEHGSVVASEEELEGGGGGCGGGGGE